MALSPAAVVRDSEQRQGERVADKKQYPRCSVIILTYNGSEYIEANLGSLEDQSYPHEKMEIIVADNGSTDDTRALVEKGFPHVKCFDLGRNLGFAGGNNRAIQYASHDFIAFLNQDTVCHRDWLKSLMEVMLADEAIGACASNVISPGDAEFEAMDRQASLPVLRYCDLSLFGYGKYCQEIGAGIAFPKLLSGCSFIIRRRVLEELKYLFDETFWMYAEDTDLSLRIFNLGHRLAVARDSVVYHNHRSHLADRPDRAKLSTRAITNRVAAFYKNMGRLEFGLFYPLILFGGGIKIKELQLTKAQKTLFFVPFYLFSFACMVAALLRLSKYSKARREILRQRRVSGFPVLRMMLRPTRGARHD